MSPLFDALKRARGNDKTLSSNQTPTDNSKPVTLAVSRQANLLPYFLAGLILLAAGFGWFTYQKNPSIPISTPPRLAPAPQLAAAPRAAVATINALPATPANDMTSKEKFWTHPVKSGKHHAKKRKQLKPVMPAGSDPLREGYRALIAGRLELAEQKYLEALALHPHEKDALLGLAVVAQRKMQTDRATSLYRQVLREDMSNTAAAAGLVSLSALADPVAAESQLRELIDLKPASAEFHYAMGNVLARQLRWGEAQQAFSHAYTLSPGNALYAYNLAVALDRLHQPAAALPYYRQAAKLANDPTLNIDAINKRIEELNSSR